MQCTRPHTPRRCGTAHEPEASDIRTPRPQSAATFAELYPKYWQDGHTNTLSSHTPRPPSRPRLLVTSAMLAAPDETSTAQPKGAVSFAKQLPRAVSPRPPAAPSPLVPPLSLSDAYVHAAPHISPRTHVVVFDRNPSPRFRTVEAPAHEGDAPAVGPKRNAAPSFEKVPGRAAAQYASHMAPCPSVQAYKERLLTKDARAACRSQQDEEYYMQVFVDEQDQCFTVGIRGATMQRAKVVMRRRAYRPQGLASPVSSVCNAKGTMKWDCLTGREGGPTAVQRSLQRRLSVVDSAAGDVAPVAPPPRIPAAPSPSRTAVKMDKMTGRWAPVSTSLRTGAIDNTTSEGAVHIPADKDPRLNGKHCPGVDFSRCRPHSAGIARR